MADDVEFIAKAQLRRFDQRLRRLEDDKEDVRERLLSLERELDTERSHRVRHEVRIGELQAILDRMVARQEMIRDE